MAKTNQFRKRKLNFKKFTHQVPEPAELSEMHISIKKPGQARFENKSKFNNFIS